MTKLLQLTTAFFCGMAVERDAYLLAAICLLCVLLAPFVVNEESKDTVIVTGKQPQKE